MEIIIKHELVEWLRIGFGIVWLCSKLGLHEIGLLFVYLSIIYRALFWPKLHEVPFIYVAFRRFLGFRPEIAW